MAKNINSTPAPKSQTQTPATEGKTVDINTGKKPQLTPQQLLKDIKRLPTLAQAVRVVNTLLDREAIDYQELAQAACPTIPELRTLGNHISTCGKLQRPDIEQREEFTPEVETLCALVRLPVNKQATPATVFYAKAPFMYPTSSPLVLVGDAVDVVAMAAEYHPWRANILGVKNENYKPGASSDDPASVEWANPPKTKTPSEPAYIRSPEKRVDNQFMKAAELVKWVETQPAKESGTKEAGLTDEALLAEYGY